MPFSICFSSFCLPIQKVRTKTWFLRVMKEYSALQNISSNPSPPPSSPASTVHAHVVDGGVHPSGADCLYGGNRLHATRRAQAVPDHALGAVHLDMGQVAKYLREGEEGWGQGWVRHQSLN